MAGPPRCLRARPAWQYWQAIWYEPAWITWLKKIAAPALAAWWRPGSTLAGSYAGSASVRTYAMTSDLHVGEKGVEVGHSAARADHLASVRDDAVEKVVG